MLAIADSCGSQTGVCWPSMDRIAHYARCSVRTVLDTINEAEEAGELEITRGEGENGTNKYRIILPEQGTQNLRTENPVQNKRGNSGGKSAVNCVPSPRKQRELDNESSGEPVGTGRNHKEPVIAAASSSEADADLHEEQDLIPFMEQSYEGGSVKRKWPKKEVSDGTESWLIRQEESLGWETFRRNWLDYLKVDDHPHPVGFAKLMEPFCKSNGNGHKSKFTPNVPNGAQQTEDDEDAKVMAMVAEMEERDKEYERKKQERIRERKEWRIKQGYID